MEHWHLFFSSIHKIKGIILEPFVTITEAQNLLSLTRNSLFATSNSHVCIVFWTMTSCLIVCSIGKLVFQFFTKLIYILDQDGVTRLNWNILDWKHGYIHKPWQSLVKPHCLIFLYRFYFTIPTTCRNCYQIINMFNLISICLLQCVNFIGTRTEADEKYCNKIYTL